ncbi:hypothetical protein JQ633_01430 [Bradyrhizobium tropiciagri]|uniref:hypothetical protein n=1 Tax=Bradyrhizobium tropiciagri TaxID=312253 RepID=UPI001BAD2605|nr:hypothetical protein [Bradyrhizobium tropiciagri]MBR0869003.1 hypothetical protein [Bradyrhizobium tropiciagri]
MGRKLDTVAKRAREKLRKAIENLKSGKVLVDSRRTIIRLKPHGEEPHPPKESWTDGEK